MSKETVEIGSMEHFEQFASEEMFRLNNAEDLDDALATYWATYQCVPDKYNPELELE